MLHQGCQELRRIIGKSSGSRCSKLRQLFFPLSTAPSIISQFGIGGNIIKLLLLVILYPSRIEGGGGVIISYHILIFDNLIKYIFETSHLFF